MTTAISRRLGTWPRVSLGSLLDRLAALDAARRQRADLAALDDRLLRDIGITRADVGAELRRPLFTALSQRSGF